MRINSALKFQWDLAKSIFLFFENRKLFSLALLVVLGLAMRLYHLDFQSLWLDELYSIVPVSPDSDLASIIENCTRDQPPFYFFCLHFFLKLVGYTAYNGRLLSVIFGVLGIISIYFLGSAIVSNRAGLFASFLTSINYFHIHYSQELRFYSLLFLLSALSYLFMIITLRKSTAKNFIFYIIFSCALMYTHYFGILILVVQGITILIAGIYNRFPRKFFYTWGFVYLILILSFVPWLSVLLGDLMILTYWVPTPVPSFFMGVQFEYFGQDAIVTYLALSMIAFPFALYFIKRSRLFSSIQEIDFIILILWVFLSYMIPYIYSVLRTPLLYERYTLVTLPAIFLLIALTSDIIRNRVIVMGFVLIILISTIFQFRMVNGYYYNIRYPQIREATELLVKNHDGVTPVFSVYAWWFNFYLYDAPSGLRILEPRTLNFKGELEKQDKIWIIGMHKEALSSEDQKLIEANFEVEKEFVTWEAFATLLRKKDPTKVTDK